jgi:hypothetical protein
MSCSSAIFLPLVLLLPLRVVLLYYVQDPVYVVLGYDCPVGIAVLRYLLYDVPPRRRAVFWVLYEVVYPLYYREVELVVEPRVETEDLLR